MRISNSKKQLAKIISENGGWFSDGTFSIQDKDDCAVWFSYKKPSHKAGNDYWTCSKVDSITGVELLPNWHQTILSRDEYFHLYPAPDADGWIEWKGGECPVYIREVVDIQYREGTVIERADAGCFEWQHYALNTDIIAYRLHKPEQSIEQMCSGVTEQNKHAHVDAHPTIEQLAAEYRNRKDYAERKQQEADAAKEEADTKLAELVAAGKAVGLAVGLAVSVAAPEPELIITDWRDLQVGDEIKVFDFECPEDNAVRKGELMGGVCVVMSARDGVVYIERKDNLPKNGQYWNATGVDACEFTLIRRPAKGDANA